jgi:hypothetical protein
MSETRPTWSLIASSGGHGEPTLPGAGPGFTFGSTRFFLEDAAPALPLDTESTVFGGDHLSNSAKTTGLPDNLGPSALGDLEAYQQAQWALGMPVAAPAFAPHTTTGHPTAEPTVWSGAFSGSE